MIIERAAPELARLASIEMESHFAAGPAPAGEAMSAAERSEGVARLTADPFIHVVADGLLGAFSSDTVMTFAEARAVAPGAGAGPLGRADERQAIASSDFITGITVVWALSPAEFGQGALELAPGSHRWPRDRAADDSDLRPAVLAPGDALIYLDKTLCRVGPNRAETPCLYALTGFGLAFLHQPDAAAALIAAAGGREGVQPLRPAPLPVAANTPFPASGSRPAIAAAPRRGAGGPAVVPLGKE